MDQQEITLIGISLTKSDWIAVANIVVTSFIGIWLASVVQRNITANRIIKDYYIQEIQDLRKLYLNFFSRIYKGECSATNMREWLKIVSNRIDCIKDGLDDSFYMKDSNKIHKTHADIRTFITGTNDFNEQYQEPSLKFSENTKNEILKYHNELLHCFTIIVVDINHAKKHGTLWKVRHNIQSRLKNNYE
jgi:hypothetical protein